MDEQLPEKLLLSGKTRMSKQKQTRLILNPFQFNINANLVNNQLEEDLEDLKISLQLLANIARIPLKKRTIAMKN